MANKRKRLTAIKVTNSDKKAANPVLVIDEKLMATGLARHKVNYNTFKKHGLVLPKNCQSIDFFNVVKSKLAEKGIALESIKFGPHCNHKVIKSRKRHAFPRGKQFQDHEPHGKAIVVKENMKKVYNTTSNELVFRNPLTGEIMGKGVQTGNKIW